MLARDKALELVSKLERTRGYPRDGVGVKNLAIGLQKASDSLKIAGNRIVEKCAEISEYCPTDADLFNVARDLARTDAVADGGYDSLAGASNNVHRAAKECRLCGGSGWEVRWYLHTHEGGPHNYVKKDRITEDQARQLEKQVDWKTQFVYSGVRRCTCPVPEDWAKRAAGDKDD